MSNGLQHIGFIADGNRRWAKAQGLPTLEGHRRGSDKVEMILDKLKDSPVKFVSFFVFSTDNWGRPQEEIDYLMDMAAKGIKRFSQKAMKNNLRIIILGRPEKVNPKLWQDIQDFVSETKDNTGLTACFCFNYGGRWEISDAAKKAAEAHETDYRPENFRKYLYHPEVPDVDLVVRTSGEQRSSGFMLWRAALAEFCFIDKYFPEITAEDIDQIISEYEQRERRFGK